MEALQIIQEPGKEGQRDSLPLALMLVSGREWGKRYCFVCCNWPQKGLERSRGLIMIFAMAHRAGWGHRGKLGTPYKKAVWALTLPFHLQYTRSLGCFPWDTVTFNSCLPYLKPCTLWHYVNYCSRCKFALKATYFKSFISYLESQLKLFLPI